MAVVLVVPVVVVVIVVVLALVLVLVSISFSGRVAVGLVSVCIVIIVGHHHHHHYVHHHHDAQHHHLHLQRCWDSVVSLAVVKVVGKRCSNSHCLQRQVFQSVRVYTAPWGWHITWVVEPEAAEHATGLYASDLLCLTADRPSPKCAE